MKPKNKYQERIVALSKTIRAPSRRELYKAHNEVMCDHFTVIRKNTCICYECSHRWKPKIIPKKEVTCPRCRRRLRFMEYARRDRHLGYCERHLTVAEFQVVQIIALYKYCGSKEKAYKTWLVVMEHWIDEKGKLTSLRRMVQGFTMYYDMWAMGTDLEIRGDSGCLSNWGGNRNRIQGDHVIMPMNYQEWLWRNGYSQSFGIPRHIFFHYLMSDSKFETLVKAGQSQLVILHYDKPQLVHEFWPSVKIAIRHKYFVEEAQMWYDHLATLARIGRDIHNPHYVCPKNLRKEHTRWIMLEHRKIHEQKLLDKRDSIAKDEVEYIHHIQPFVDLYFTDGEIEVRPLTHIMEFFEEGLTHHHCVFTNSYYNNHDCLYLSASIGEDRIETVEVYLPDGRISQSRGLQNKATYYNKRIVELVQSNMKEILKRAKKIPA